jgi:cyanate permease
MGRQQVILRGESWKKQILVWSLLIVLGLAVIHELLPGALSSAFSAVFDAIASLYAYMGDLLNSLREIAHNISGWYR